MKWLSCIFLLLCSCVNKPEHPKNQFGNISAESKAVRFYKDIDLASLKGEDLLPAFKYPCFEISDTTGKRIVNIYIDTNQMLSQEYTRDGPGWKRIWNYQGDTCRIFVYQFIRSDGVITFSYSDTAFSLLDLSFLTGNKEYIYYPANRQSVLPDPGAFDKLKEKASTIVSYEWYYKGRIVEEVAHYNFKLDPSKNHVSKKCYATDYFSPAWWLYFSPFYAKEVNCK